MTITNFMTSGAYEPISNTENAKTGTVMKKYVFTPDANPKLKGLRRRIEYGPKTPLKQMGIDRVAITKVPGQKSVVRFMQESGGVTHGVTFQQGAPEIKTFIKMLKECAKKGFKPDISTVRALFKVIK